MNGGLEAQAPVRRTDSGALIRGGPPVQLQVLRVANGFVVFPPNWCGGSALDDKTQVAESVEALVALVGRWAEGFDPPPEAEEQDDGKPPSFAPGSLRLDLGGDNKLPDELRWHDGPQRPSEGVRRETKSEASLRLESAARPE